MLWTYMCAAALLACARGSVVRVEPGAPSAARALDLLLLHNNDMHARFEQTSQLSGVCTPSDRDAGRCYGGFPRVAHVVKEARAAAAAGTGPPVLYLNAGDTYTGTAWFTIYKWRIAADCINALQPDAVSLGNHEFDNGVSGLTPFIENITSPVLAANLVLEKVPELKNERNLHKSVVFDIDGVKVGVIGYLTPETQVLAIRTDVEYIDEVIALKEEVANLKKEGVNILIALGHSGFLKDLDIAREVEGIDVVIGGHTNTFLWNGTAPDAEKIQGPYPTIVTQKSGRTVLVVQAYAYTKYLGKLHVVFDAEGEVVSYDGNPILLDKTIAQDAEVLEVIERYREGVMKISEEIIGNTSVVLDGGSCRLQECNLGNLIADAIVYQYALRYVGERWTDAPAAIVQGGGIRSSIAPPNRPAPVTHGDLLTVMPFESKIVALTMNRTILYQALEHSVASYHPISAPGQFLQFSGIRVVYDLAKPPGSRVESVVVRCWSCAVPQFYEVDSRDYTILMPIFLAQGGDGFSMFTGLPFVEMEYDELYCTMDYIRRRSPVYPEVAERIILHNVDAIDDTVEPPAIDGSASMAIPSIIVAFLAHCILSAL